MSVDFAGLAVALATPFQDDGALDLEGYRRLVRHVVDGGVDVLLALGSTGEAATLEESERDAVIEASLEESQGRPVMVGTGHNATPQAVAMTRRAQELGAHAALVVSPYYNKPTPDGLVEHYRQVADAAPGLPLVVYNVPGRTGANLVPSTIARLWENAQVVGLKESSGNLPQIAEIARALPDGRVLLSGDDNMALGSIAVGAEGLVSVLGNLMPAETAAMVAAARSGDRDAARDMFHRLLPVMDALFTESNPIPLKAGLAMLGLAGDAVRMPLVTCSDAARDRLRKALRGAGVDV